MNSVVNFPRSIRAVPDPLSLYIRLSRYGSSAITNILASGIRSFSGVVIDSPAPKDNGRQKELIAILQSHRLDIVLDTQAIRLATPGGYTETLGKLPWGSARMHTRRNFDTAAIVTAIAGYALTNGFTEVMAPTHLLESSTDPWIDVDIEATNLLRRALDEIGGRDIQIIYSLAIPLAALRDSTERAKFIARLRHVPIDMLWLRVAGFGSDSSPSAVRAYLDCVTAFHHLEMPVVADNVGGVVGKALLAFGAVSGIAHGITMGERFDPGAWKRIPKSDGGFSMPTRVYFPNLDLSIKTSAAEQLLSTTKSKAHFGCNDPKCCARGLKDMLEAPARHFLYQRMGEIAQLSPIPETLRAKRFIDELRNISDSAVAATKLDIRDETLVARLLKNRIRLDALRIALTAQENVQPPASFARIAPTRASRENRVGQ